MNLETLCRFSHKYGANPEFVLAGGGNTSAKNAKTLVIKGSGSALATIEPDQFVKLDRAKLNAMWDKTYPEGEAEREAAVLADLMAARAFGEEKSVRALKRSYTISSRRLTFCTFIPRSSMRSPARRRARKRSRVSSPKPFGENLPARVTRSPLSAKKSWRPMKRKTASPPSFSFYRITAFSSPPIPKRISRLWSAAS